MGLSLKKEEMVQFLEAAKSPGENFNSMLWGTVYADLSSFQGHSAASQFMAGFGGAGVAGSLDNAFCYIGLTEHNMYVIALDSYNTSKIIGTFALTFANMTSLDMRKGFGGSYTVTVGYGSNIDLTVKGVSIGTDIKDQKERLAGFVAAIEALQGRFRQ